MFRADDVCFLVPLCLPPQLDCELLGVGDGVLFIYVSSGSSPVSSLEQVGRRSINICCIKECLESCAGAPSRR